MLENLGPLRKLTVLGLMVGWGAAEAQNPPPVFSAPKRYYLALGDSIAFGYQASKAHAGLPPSAFNTGYVDVFAARLREIQSGITVINYGCPGETLTSMDSSIDYSGTFVTGKCPWTFYGQLPLHDNFTGSQFRAAIAFLEAHPGEVSPVTVTLWGNDVAELVTVCGGEPTCIGERAPAFARQFGSELSRILGDLRSAAPEAEIIVTGAWDSFLDAFEFADPLFQTLNVAIASAAAANRVRFADPFPVFNPQGDLNAEKQTICTLLLLCTENDSHPSDAGYRALAGVVFDASQYIRLLQ